MSLQFLCRLQYFRIVIVIIISLCSNLLFGQLYEPIIWEEQPVLSKLHAPFPGASSIGMLYEIDIDVRDTDRSIPFTYETHHTITRVRDQTAIDRHNKGYISMYNVDSLVELKVRVISAEGVVKEMPKESFKYIENFEDHGPFMIYAVEGLTPGSEIEVLYKIKTMDLYFGRNYFQFDYPIQEARFSIVSPATYKLNAKGYNGFETISYGDYQDRICLVGKERNIMPINDERYASRNNSRVRIDHRIISRMAIKTDIPSEGWQSIVAAKSQAIYFYENNVDKKIKSLIKEQGWNKLKSETEKIVAVEEYIKTNFRLIDEYSPELYEAMEVLKSKTANRAGVLKLMVKIFDFMEIKYSLVFTVPSTNPALDPEFPFWYSVSDQLLYFPADKKYLDPLDITVRYGMISDAYINGYAYFLPYYNEQTQIQEPSKIKYISDREFPVSENNLDAIVNLDLENGITNIAHRQEYTFLRAQQLRPIYSIVNENEKEELNKQVFKGMINGAEVANVKIENIGNDYATLNKPFIITGDVTTNALLEQAGDDYIFSLGQVIGPQVEMYQENERQCDIVMSHPVLYKRKIRVNIPEGFTVKAIDGATLKEQVKQDNKVIMRFYSYYAPEGNSVVFTLVEEYQEVFLKREKINDFRRVINASADFNKAVIIFEKVL